MQDMPWEPPERGFLSDQGQEDFPERAILTLNPTEAVGVSKGSDREGGVLPQQGSPISNGTKFERREFLHETVQSQGRLEQVGLLQNYRQWLVRVSNQIALENLGLNKMGPTFWQQGISKFLVCPPTGDISQEGCQVQHSHPHGNRSPLFQGTYGTWSLLSTLGKCWATQTGSDHVDVYQTS